jgi:hypothetical protein
MLVLSIDQIQRPIFTVNFPSLEVDVLNADLLDCFYTVSLLLHFCITYVCTLSKYSKVSMQLSAVKTRRSCIDVATQATRSPAVARVKSRSTRVGSGFTSCGSTLAAGVYAPKVKQAKVLWDLTMDTT